jgi:hypothetical protein
MFESSTLMNSLQETWFRILEMAPDVALAFLLLLVGWLVARPTSLARRPGPPRRPRVRSRARSSRVHSSPRDPHPSRPRRAS